MEPVLIVALVMAFGVRSTETAPDLTSAEVQERLIASLLVIGGQLLVILAIGRILAAITSRWALTPIAQYRMHRAGSRGLAALTLGAYAYLLFQIDWPGLVDRGLLSRGSILIDEILILAPFLLWSVAAWWSLYPTERVVRGHSGRSAGSAWEGASRHVIRRARQSLGMVLPAVLIYAFANDLIARYRPDWHQSRFAPMVGMLMMGGLVLTVSPCLVRLSWSTRRLPPGPLRDRLERLARRLGFRYTDILVWESDGAFVNAGVTGALPWYRYILLTDSLISSLDDREIEAVFGHEVGHVIHRHLAYFGFFFVGSLGVMALVGQVTGRLTQEILRVAALDGTSPQVGLIVETVLLLIGLATYFLIVFGHLSRRFERQADVFGCRAVSCGRDGCPPHLDVQGARLEWEPTPETICPVGIRIFANALANVAMLNGLETKARSWRHGSIAKRIHFLEGIENRPDLERAFQTRVRRLRLALAFGLLLALVVASWTGALDQL